MKISKKLRIIFVFIIIFSIVAIFGVYQISKGTLFHQLNSLHLKYTIELQSQLRDWPNSKLNLNRVKETIELIKFQPVECLDNINQLDAFIMRSIGTERAIQFCKDDIAVANQLLLQFQIFEKSQINIEQLYLQMGNAANQFWLHSSGFEKDITATVDFIKITVNTAVTSFSLITLWLVFTLSRSILLTVKAKEKTESELVEIKINLEKLVRERTQELNKSKNIAVKAHEWVNILLDTTPEATICSNEKGQIIRSNKKAVTLLGYSQEELLNMTIEQLVPKQYASQHVQDRDDFFKHSTLRLMGENRDLSILTKQGKKIDVEISLNIAILDDEKTAISIVRDITENKKLTQKLEHQVSHDFLTGLMNRVELERSFVKEIDRAKRYQRNLSIFMIDIDFFKSVNDTYGHGFGDKVLQSFSKNLEANMRQVDYCSRFGGEEFVVILPETSIENASIQAERLRKSVESMTIDDGENKLSITISIGIANYPKNGEGFQEILNKADDALYKAKESGRNRVENA